MSHVMHWALRRHPLTVAWLALTLIAIILIVIDRLGRRTSLDEF